MRLRSTPFAPWPRPSHTMTSSRIRGGKRLGETSAERSSRKTRRIAIFILSAFLSTASTLPLAFAEDDPATVQARARFNEGVTAYDKGQFEAARLSFQQAYLLKKHPAVLVNLAQSSAKSGHSLDAAKYFQQYLKENGATTTQQRGDAEKGLEEARKQIGRIEIVAPSGTEIILDDKDRLGSTPFPDPIDVEPGPHSLKSTAETVRVNASAGQRVQAKFGVANLVAPADVTPAPSDAARPGNAPPGDPAGAKAGLFSPPVNMTPVVVGAVVAGLGLVSTIVFAVFKNDAQSKADSVASMIRSRATSTGRSSTGICSSTDPTVQTAFNAACQTLKDNNSTVDADATIANVSLVVTIAAAAFAGGWYLFAPKREGHPAALKVTPYLDYGNAGIILGGSF